MISQKELKNNLRTEIKKELLNFKKGGKQIKNLPSQIIPPIWVARNHLGIIGGYDFEVEEVSLEPATSVNFFPRFF